MKINESSKNSVSFNDSCNGPDDFSFPFSDQNSFPQFDKLWVILKPK